MLVEDVQVFIMARYDHLSSLLACVFSSESVALPILRRGDPLPLSRRAKLLSIPFRDAGGNILPIIIAE